MTSASTFSNPPLANNQPHSNPPNQTLESDSGQNVQPDSIAGQASKLLIHGLAPSIYQLHVEFSQLALKQIEEYGSSDLSKELGGVLLGHVEHFNAITSVKIYATLPIQSDDHGPIHFTFKADSWAGLHRDKEEQYPNLEVVGWFHTHPDLGAFFSADDVIVHSAAFVLPWQIGLVLDPVRGEVCLVGWRRDGAEINQRSLIGLPGFYEILDHEETSIVGWQFVRASIWNQVGYSLADRDDRMNIYAPTTDWPALPEINPWWGVILGGLSLLISLLLLIDRLLAS